MLHVRGGSVVLASWEGLESGGEWSSKEASWGEEGCKESGIVIGYCYDDLECQSKRASRSRGAKGGGSRKQYGE